MHPANDETLTIAGAGRQVRQGRFTLERLFGQGVGPPEESKTWDWKAKLGGPSGSGSAGKTIVAGEEPVGLDWLPDSGLPLSYIGSTPPARANRDCHFSSGFRCLGSSAHGALRCAPVSRGKHYENQQHKRCKGTPFA